MRLTLRTLLAYRDGVLSPQDQEDMHRRIQQNGPIASLLRQINELVAGNELRSPKLTATGLGDVNNVAEYLDDALTTDKVAELERLCLQNADHLCELAHCHQLLAEAMQTHISVPESLMDMASKLTDPRFREQAQKRLLTRSSNRASRAIETPEENSGDDRLEVPRTQLMPAGQPSDSSSLVKSAITGPGASTIQQGGLDLEATPLASEVPAYLLASQRKRWQIPAAILALTLLLVILVWQSIGSLDSLAALWSTSAAVPVDPIPSDPQRDADQASIVPEANDKAAPTPPSVTEGSSQDSSTEGSLAAAADRSEATAETQPDSDASDPENLSESIPATPESDEAPNTLATGLSISPDDRGQGRALIFVKTNDEKLLLLGEQAQPISQGRVIIPPSVRSAISLGSWNWTTGGSSVVEFETDSATPVMASNLFRGLLANSQPNAPLILKTPVGTYRLSTTDPEAWLTVEVAYRPILRGSLSQAGTHAPVLVIVAFTDSQDAPKALAKIESVDGRHSALLREPGSGFAVIGEQAPVEFKLLNPPRWYGSRSVRLIDQEAVQDFVKVLQNSQQPAEELVSQLTRHERPELAALAIQTSLMLGNFRPLVSELLLSDRLRTHWTSSLELARQLAIGNQNTPTIVEELMQEEFGQNATRLYELFQGLSSEQQNNEGLISLIKGLESDLLPVRILSAYEMAQLTGSDHGYLPHAPIKSTIQQIRRLQTTGKLNLLPVPDPIWERTAQ